MGSHILEGLYFRQISQLRATVSGESRRKAEKVELNIGDLTQISQIYSSCILIRAILRLRPESPVPLNMKLGPIEPIDQTQQPQLGGAKLSLFSARSVAVSPREKPFAGINAD